MTLLAADSWLVDDGRVRGWELHWRRFGGTVEAAGVAADRVRELEAEVRDEIPASGRWFPRVECDDSGNLSWQLREAPERQPEVACLAAPVPDWRVAPRAKGPDLERLVALREGAAHAGAGELLLGASDGTLLEGSLSSLLWWDDDALCVVDDNAPILDGVTRRLLIGLARDAGIAVVTARPVATDLHGCEVWLTSALHGIRAVTSWVPDGPAAGRPARAAQWQEKLEALALGIAAQ